jgi:hypothetical protein
MPIFADGGLMGRNLRIDLRTGRPPQVEARGGLYFANGWVTRLYEGTEIHAAPEHSSKPQELNDDLQFFQGPNKPVLRTV